MLILMCDQLSANKLVVQAYREVLDDTLVGEVYCESHALSLCACAAFRPVQIFRPLHFLSRLVRSASVYRSFLQSLRQVADSVDVVKRRPLKQDMESSKQFLVEMMLGRLDRSDASESLDELAHDGGAAYSGRREKLLEVMDGVVSILNSPWETERIVHCCRSASAPSGLCCRNVSEVLFFLLSQQE